MVIEVNKYMSPIFYSGTRSTSVITKTQLSSPLRHTSSAHNTSYRPLSSTPYKAQGKLKTSLHDSIVLCAIIS